MGFSTLDGLMMGSRCGSLDPGVTLYLMQHEGLDDAAIRTAVCTKLAASTGLELDWQANNANKPIHTPSSPIAIPPHFIAEAAHGQINAETVIILIIHR